MDCEKDGCVRRVFSRNLCHKHYEEERLANAPPCEIDGCEAKAERRGMCNKHYRQQKLATSPPCSVPGCGRPSFVGGHCQTHHKRIQRYGSLDADARAFDRGARERHHLYQSWNWHKRHGNICDKWLEFWTFVADVGERPSPNHYLRRKDSTSPIGPGNWSWRERVGSKDCAKRYQREWRSKNARRSKGYGLKKLFGITIDDYDRMLDEQHGVCAICEQPEKAKSCRSETARELAVDHCHDTGLVRGLLCTNCNMAIGALDKKHLLYAAMKYLEKSRKK